MKIFIIHGWTYNLSKWSLFCKQLKEHGLEPIQLKVPGLTAPSQNKPWTIPEYVEWLHAQLKDESKIVIIGHSNGGRILLNYASKYPHKLKHLFLIDSAGIQQKPAMQIRNKTFKVMSKIGKPLGAVPGSKKIVSKITGGKDYYEAEPLMKETMKNMLESDQKLRLENITIPTTIIWGQNDELTPLSNGRQMAAKIKGAQLFLIKDGRHAPFFTHPNRVADIVAKAINQ